MIDVIATLPHYWDHMAPVWDALPEGARGSRHGHPDRARRGLRAAEGTARSSDAVIVAAWQDLQRAQKAGYRRIAYLEHGIGQSFGNRHPAYPGGRYRHAVDLFLSPNETAAGMDRAAYPGARVEVVGCPKLDGLPRRVPDGQTTVATSFHWDSQVAPETRSAFGHYRAVLPDLAAAFNLIGHAHPRAERLMSRTYAKLGIEFVATFEEVCRRADLLVMDSNSCLYEFASTGRPVVVLNIPAFRRNVNHGLRFWAAADVGIQVDRPADLIPAVRLALTDPPAQQTAREAALAITYGIRHGAAEAAAAAICDWLAADRAVAA